MNIKPSQIQAEFPYKALGEILGDAVKGISDTVQAPIAIAGQAVLTTAALIAQGHANVKMDHRVYPLSLFGLTIAGSGDRKTSTDKIALKPVTEYQSKLMRQFMLDKVEHTHQLKAYNQAEKNILKTFSDSEQSEITTALEDLEEVPNLINPKMLCSEPTLEGLQKGFLYGTPGQGIFNDEGGQFFAGHAMSSDNKTRTITGLSRLWDGSPIERTRSGNNESLYLENRRLTAHFMVQPVLAEKIMADRELIEQGFLARFLIVAPTSIAGTRLYKVNNEPSKVITNYYQLITGLLNTQPNIDSLGGLILENIEPDNSAKSIWVKTYNQIESQLDENGELFNIKPTANKVCENILRIAGTLAVVEKTVTINDNQMTRAVELGQYYLESYLWIVEQNKRQINHEQSQLLYNWMLHSKHINEGNITLTKILQNSPKSINARSKSRAIELMAILVNSQHVLPSKNNNKNENIEWKIRDYVG